MFNSTSHVLTQEEIARTAIPGTIVYVGGFIGNLLSLMIFLRVEIRRVSTGLLFLYLTISNSVQLLTLTMEFIDVVYAIRLLDSVILRCRLLYWLQNVSRALCSFIACTISIDRMSRVCYPIRARGFCTCRLASKIVLIYIIVFMVLHSFYLLPYMGENSNGVCSSDLHPTFNKFMTTIWPPIRTFLVCILPVTVMILTNVRSLRRIRASRRRVTSHLSNASYLTNTETMLIFITISNVLAFLTTQIPFHIYSTVVRYKKSINYIRTVMLLWSSLYFGVGFYVYSLISPYFRSKFIATLRECFKRQPPSDNIRRNTISQHVPY